MMTLGRQSSRFRSPSWIFNGLMLWGAGLGFLIGLAIGGLIDTLNHKGPGVVHHDDWSEKLSETEYKRHHYGNAGLMLAGGLLFWFIVARIAKNDTAKAEAKEAYLESQIRRANTYHHAFASALDEDVRERAASAARLSDAVQDAQKDEELASSIFYAASKTAKGSAE